MGNRQIEKILWKMKSSDPEGIISYPKRYFSMTFEKIILQWVFIPNPDLAQDRAKRVKSGIGS